MNPLGEWITVEKIPQYWQSLRPLENTGPEQIAEWAKKVAFMDEVSAQHNAVVFLWNAFTNRFIYMSDKLQLFLAIDPARFTAENGIDQVLANIHPDHVPAVLLMIRQLVVDFCREQQRLNFRHTKICFNYLFRNGHGEYMQILQRAVVLEVDEAHQPKLVLNFTYHVDYIKRPDSVGGMVITDEETLLFDYNPLTRQVEQAKAISPQELTVLQLLGKGLSTKAIAGKLYLSPHTVDTHRRSLIKKTNCLDTTGVVAFARMTGLI